MGINALRKTKPVTGSVARGACWWKVLSAQAGGLSEELALEGGARAERLEEPRGHLRPSPGP